MKLVNGTVALKLLEKGEKIYSEVQPYVSYYLDNDRLWFHNEKRDYKETSLLNRKDIINKYFYVKEETLNKYIEIFDLNIFIERLNHNIQYLGIEKVELLKIIDSIYK